jgi:PAS domain S-box-containing protein
MIGMDDYLMFHCLSELFSISVAGCVFAITWSTRIHRPKDSSFFLLIGIGSLFVGGIDLVHTLAYKGMNLIPGYDSDLPTQLWIAARYLQSLSFMAASGLLVLQNSRAMDLSARAPYILLAGYAVITALLLFAIFARVFPVCFIEGSGLTPFKRISEYVICVILTGALVLLRQSRGYLDQEMLRTLMAAIVISILSELSFAIYTDVYGRFNMIGHILKIIVFIALYKAIVQIGIQKPYTLLARDLRDSELRYRTIVENSNDALLIQDFKGIITDVNKNACRMLGYRRDELVGANIETISGRNGHRNISEQMKKCGKHDMSLFESEVIRKDGTPLPVESSVSVVSRDGAGMIQSFVRDITERIRAAAELKASESRYRDLAESIPAMLWATDAQGVTIDQNLRWDEYTGQTFAQSRGDGWKEVVHPDDIQQVIDLWAKSIRTGDDYLIEYRIRRASDGVYRWHSVQAVLRKDPQGKPLGWFGTCIDIEDRKHAEAQLKASLAEKEVLLKEIHHRVKNNMQVISSLVSLQADSLTDKRSSRVFSDVRDRVRAMAMVHEKLYQTDDLAFLDFADYAGSLMQYLWSVHGASVNNVVLKLETVPVQLPIDTAVNCGLILNELASNAVKHAFPGGGGGEVTLAIKHDPSTGAVCLRVRDNGIGLPADLDWRKSESLGLRLVQMLTAQMHGTVHADYGSHTEFLINFNLNEIPS